MNIITDLQQAFYSFLVTTFSIDESMARRCEINLNADPAKQQFGDLNSNAAMILAKELKRTPREIAQEIAQNFTYKSVEKIEIAGPGFLNFFLTQEAFYTLAQQLFEQKDTFFKPANITPQKINIEFISANPTGPLHFGHGRGGIIGDVLGNILSFLGHNVTKEYYINDAGRQMQKLGQSFKIRCQQLAGMDITLPEGAYFGEYLVELAKEFMAEHGQQLLDQPDEFFTSYAKTKMLERIKKTLKAYGITFDVWFSEKSLHESGEVEAAIKELDKRGYIFEQEGALWFKSTAFGDDKDRVVRKASGELTYVAADIAYLRNKIERGSNHLIMTLGHDHHSYMVRLQAVHKALSLEKIPLDIILYQLVHIKEGGQLMRLSKRAGRMITLTDVIETVGTDVARFFYLNRKADAQHEFDLDLAIKKTDENPVYYVQYAYVRTGSIQQKADEIEQLQNIGVQDAQLMGSEEQFLLKKIASLKELLESIGRNEQTHLLAYYVHELTQLFSTYYAQHRVIDLTNPNQSRGRLLMTALLRSTLETCFKILGISQPERM